MSVILKKDGQVLHVALSGELNVASAGSLYEELFAQIDDDSTLVLDATQVERVDTSIAQLVCFASKRVREFHLQAASRAWSDAWAQLGLDRAQPTVR